MMKLRTSTDASFCCSNCRFSSLSKLRNGTTKTHCVRTSTKERVWSPNNHVCHGFKSKVAEKESITTPSPVTEIKITHTFKTGLEVTGTLEQIQSVGKLIGEIFNPADALKGYYMSESKGLIKLSEMKTAHLRRALLKHARTYYENMYVAEDSNTEFLEKFVDLASDETISALYEEIYSRIS